MRLYRLKKPSQWGLDSKKLYLAQETENGFKMDTDKENNQWAGLPKSVVLRSKMFEPYNKEAHKAALEKKNRRHHFIKPKF